MKHRLIALHSVCLLLLIHEIVGTPAHADPPVKRSLPQPPKTVLFIGNSLTYFNGGLETHLVRLAQSATQPKKIRAERATKGGATLKLLYHHQPVRDKLRKGGFDVVIVQGDIPEIKEHSVEPFLKYVRAFHQEINKQGATTLLFMAWPYQRLDWATLPQIAKAHREIGGELGIPVAPVGLAFDRAMKERSQLNLLGKDNEHQNMHGTYLAANVIYATLFDQSPQGCTYRPEEVSAEQATFLQRIAWESVTEWRKNGRDKK